MLGAFTTQYMKYFEQKKTVFYGVMCVTLIDLLLGNGKCEKYHL